MTKPSRKAFLLGVGAALTALAAAPANSAFIRATASTCDIVSDGRWVPVQGDSIPQNPGNQGHIVEYANGQPLKIYCPIEDASNLAVSDGSLFNQISLWAYSGSTTVSFQSQQCSDFQDSTGGTCDSVRAAASGQGFRSINSSIGVAWQGLGNKDYLHYLYVFLPAGCPGCGLLCQACFTGSEFMGYTLGHS